VTASAAPADQIAYRAAYEDDLEAQYRVFCRAEGQLRQRHAFDWSDPPFEVMSSAFRHLLQHDAERCFVAESEGAVVGFSAALVRDTTWFLAALFIDPDFQGRGIGRRLFELAFADAPARRITITNSIQPVSNALYAKHGLIPTTPIFLFRGRPTVSAPPNLFASTGTPADLAALDLAAYGFDRHVDHQLWSSGAERTLWSRGARPVAYSYAWPSGRIGPLVGLDEVNAADALKAELARRIEPWIEIPGTSRSLVTVTLEAGMKMDPPPGLLLLSAEVEPPRSLAISRYMLF
jgi:GNAT superfamily N-acetyltransferase